VSDTLLRGVRKKVVGASTRTVFNSFASYSAHSGDLELYG